MFETTWRRVYSEYIFFGGENYSFKHPNTLGASVCPRLELILVFLSVTTFCDHFYVMSGMSWRHCAAAECVCCTVTSPEPAVAPEMNSQSSSPGSSALPSEPQTDTARSRAQESISASFVAVNNEIVDKINEKTRWEKELCPRRTCAVTLMDGHCVLTPLEGAVRLLWVCSYLQYKNLTRLTNLHS